MNNQDGRNNANQGKEGNNEGGTNSKRRGYQGKGHKQSNQFKGETPGMQGKVFRLQSEQIKKGEFKEAVEALERYAGRTYPLDTTKLQDLFKNFETPTVDEPTIPGSSPPPPPVYCQRYDSRGTLRCSIPRCPQSSQPHRRSLLPWNLKHHLHTIPNFG